MSGATNVLKQAGGAVGDVLTLGTSHIKGSPTGKLGQGLGTIFSGGVGTKGDVSNLWKGGNSATPNQPALQGGQSNPDLLAQTGGAPVLANIALGVSPKDALAGYLGVNPQDWDTYVQNLSPKDASSLQATQKQLETIQSNTNLRNQAVQQVINDFPNITAKIAQARASSGQEFDQVTQGYMKQALDSTAAKYAAGGNLSSGAANEAFAKTGAGMGLQKLDYMGQREAASSQQEMAGYGSRLAEVNSLRDFQNTMLGNKISEGFSAAQANLGRISNTDIANTAAYNQRMFQEQQSKDATTNAMFGALGSLGGAWLGGSMLAKSATPPPPVDNTQSGYFNMNAPKFYTTSYGRTMGGR